jgi:hypothetical protein
MTGETSPPGPDGPPTAGATHSVSYVRRQIELPDQALNPST